MVTQKAKYREQAAVSRVGNNAFPFRIAHLVRISSRRHLMSGAGGSHTGTQERDTPESKQKGPGAGGQRGEGGSATRTMRLYVGKRQDRNG